MKRSIAILGEYTPTSQTHLATTAAIEHSGALLETDIEGVWVPTESIGPWLGDRLTGI
jgi:CTP synthase (UTP-ammonia lyase)